MSRVVYRYNIQFPGETIDAIEGKVVGAEYREGALRVHPTIDVWIEVEHGAETAVRRFEVVGTGQTFDDDSMEHIMTFPRTEGGLVFHLYEGAVG